MGDENDSLVAEHALDQVVKDVLRGVVVHSRQGVVQQHCLGIEVGSTGKVQALALASGQVDPAKATEGAVTHGQHLQIHLQGTGVDNLAVLLLIELQAKGDVVANAQVLHPSSLQQPERVCQKLSGEAVGQSIGQV